MPVNIDLSPVAQELYDRCKWLHSCSILLLTSVDAVRDYLSKNDTPYIAYDLETTGLNSDKDKIVGICLAYKEDEGVYIPVAHEVGSNLNVPLDDLRPILNEHFATKTVLAYNAKFELGFSYYAEIDLPQFEDVMVSVHLRDTGWDEIGLKPSGKHLLNLETIEIKELFPSTKGKKYILFHTVHPTDAVVYGAQDALLTLRLHHHLAHVREEQATIYQLENEIVKVVHWMDIHNRIKIDCNYLTSVQQDIEKQIKYVRHQIFQAVGKEFVIDSPKKLGDILFEELKIPLPEGEKKTKTGQWPTGEKVLDKLVKQDTHPVLPWIGEYRSLVKIKSTYVEAMMTPLNAEGRGRVSYHALSAPTGRFSCGRGKDAGYISVNFQSLPSTTDNYMSPAREIKNHELGFQDPYVLAEYWKKQKVKDPVTLVEEVTKPKYRKMMNVGPCMRVINGKAYCFAKTCIETCKNKAAACHDSANPTWTQVNMALTPDVRRGVVADPDSLIWALDYSGIELRVCAAMSKEPVWLEAFKNKEDLHGKTAEKIFGKGFTKIHRGYAKTCLAQGEEILTLKGPVKVEDLDKDHNNLLLSWQGEPQKWRVWEPRLADCVSVKTEDLLEEVVSKDHRYRILDGCGKLIYRAADQIQVGDFLVVPREIYNESREKALANLDLTIGGFRFDEDLCFLLGFLIGDGYVSRSSDHNKNCVSYVIDKSFKDLATRVTEIQSRVSDKEVNWNNPPDKNYYRFTHFSGKFHNFLRDLGGLNPYDKYVPWPIPALPSACIRSFLRGLYSSDGSASGTISFKNTSLELVKGIVRLQHYLGYEFSTLIDSEGTSPTSGEAWTCWGVSIMAYSQSRFLEEIGFEQAKRRDSVRIVKNPDKEIYGIPNMSHVASQLRSCIKGTWGRATLEKSGFYRLLSDDLYNIEHNVAASMTKRVLRNIFDAQVLFPKSLVKKLDFLTKFKYERVTQVQPVGIRTVYTVSTQTNSYLSASGRIQQDCELISKGGL